MSADIYTNSNDSRNSEIWKPIPNYEGIYEVSSLGRVKSLKRNYCFQDRILKHAINACGYLYVGLYKNKKRKKEKVHKLVALAFIGKRPKGLQINHIDGVKTNNTPDNLEYCTPSENKQHAWDTGLCAASGIGCKGENHGNSRLTELQVLTIRRIYSQGNITQKELGKRYGVGRTTINAIINRKKWKHI